MATNETTLHPEQSWDEEQSIAALAKLEQLQGQLDDLRLTIDRVMQPLASPPKNLPLFYMTYKQAIVASQNNIKSFRTHWNSQDIQSIFEHTRESQKGSADLSASSQVPRWGWKQAEAARQKAIPRKRKRQDSVAEEAPEYSEADIGKVLDNLRTKYPRIKLETKDGNHDIGVQFMHSGTMLKFHIIVGQGTNDRGKLRVECSGQAGSTPLHKMISRCMESRPRANDLQYLMDMIAAYRTVNGKSCAKCECWADASGRPPMARRSKQISSEDKPPETIWEAFHAGCLD